MAENFRFINAKDGWMTGGPDGETYATHDAGDSWAEVSLPKPAAVGPDTGADYSLPEFASGRNGFLTAQYSVGPLLGPDLSTLVLFRTEDGGRTWRQDRILSRLPIVYSSDATDDGLIAAHSELAKNGKRQHGDIETTLTLYSTGPDRNVRRNCGPSVRGSCNTANIRQ
jgi:hypothetical protein